MFRQSFEQPDYLYVSKRQYLYILYLYSVLLYSKASISWLHRRRIINAILLKTWKPTSNIEVLVTRGKCLNGQTVMPAQYRYAGIALTLAAFSPVIYLSVDRWLWVVRKKRNCTMPISRKSVAKTKDRLLCSSRNWVRSKYFNQSLLLFILLDLKSETHLANFFQCFFFFSHYKVYFILTSADLRQHIS